jgi:histidyl-tRNA synthetase
MSDKLRSITGMNDILPTDVRQWQKLERVARQVLESYGFSEIRTPIIEATELFCRGIGEGTQVVQKEMYTFDDKGGDSVTMRPEGTASVVRSYIQHSLMAKDALTKLYYIGPMFRYERPQKGRLRQFHQVGAELIGVDSPLADAEIVILLDRMVQKLGIRDYELKVNSLGTVEERKQYLEKLVSFFAATKDQLCTECHERLEKNPLRIFDCKVHSCRKVCKEAPILLDHLTDESSAEFKKFQECLKQAGVKYVIDPHIVRGLDYYEKTAFEFTSNQLGSQSAFVGGGRYNKLISELGGKETPAVGFGMGCERMIMLMEACEEQKEADLNGVYFVSLNEDGYGVCRGLMQQVRDAGILADMDYTVKSMKSQMRRANKLGFRYAAIVGEDELAINSVVLKDLQTGDQKVVKQEELLGSL